MSTTNFTPYWFFNHLQMETLLWSFPEFLSNLAKILADYGSILTKFGCILAKCSHNWHLIINKFFGKFGQTFSRILLKFIKMWLYFGQQ